MPATTTCKACDDLVTEDLVDLEIVLSNIPRDRTVFEEGKNYIFDASGRPLKAGKKGNEIKIMVNGVAKSPSELDITDKRQLLALSRVALYLSKEMNIPNGTWFGTGREGKDAQDSSENAAFTIGKSPMAQTCLQTLAQAFACVHNSEQTF